jgi:hypothetical protein
VVGAATTWQAWESVLPEWKSHKPEAAIASNKDDRTKLAAAVSSAAKAWKPPPSLAVPSIDDIGPDVPRNLHERLALVARLSLQEYLQDAVAQPTVVEFTTTDVTAALSVAGVIVSDKGKRTVGASLGLLCAAEGASVGRRGLMGDVAGVVLRDGCAAGRMVDLTFQHGLTLESASIRARVRPQPNQTLGNARRLLPWWRVRPSAR